MGLHKEQVANTKANKYVWTHHIWTCQCEKLYKLENAKKANYVEKVDETFSFFKASGKAQQFENVIWLKASGCGLRSAYPAIR
jgi:hypothetical protein